MSIPISAFESRNDYMRESDEKRLAPFRCPECGYVGSHKTECIYRSEYVATGNPYVWKGFTGK